MKLVLAHRGIHYVYPENSYNSIIEIFKYKSDKFTFGVELDINLTKDNKLVLFHDEMLDNNKIIDLDYNEIVSIDKNIPLLEDILIEFQNKEYMLDIELKEYPEFKFKYCDILINLLKKYNISYFTSTFNVEIYKILTSNNIRCYLISHDNILSNDIVHYSYINSNSKGVYTIYDNEFNDKYLNKIKDVDILITDDIDKLIEYLSE